MMIDSDDWLIEIAKKMQETERKYCDKFGENSLDRVILGDPLHPTPEGFKKAINTLEKAIKNNKPLEQTPKEIWDNLIF